MAKILKETEILINEKVYEIKPIKMKYIKVGFQDKYYTMRQDGLIKIMRYSDYESFLQDFLTAVFDSEEIATELFDEVDVKNIKEILDITKKLNDIEDLSSIKNVETPEV